ncbi:hypothetical protein SASPL_131718 [Salvia splendens]|uniref:Uncharacterized protein n=1 Tax=Salvia splendens TaxID=180675 RepID=A0A8X8X9S8_SALSN|nr:hypothetical protein SASPL_131718 [Salvia splendens]
MALATATATLPLRPSSFTSNSNSKCSTTRIRISAQISTNGSPPLAKTFSGKPEADVIVIGSGIGGLCCGALLARYDQDVLVLESHDLPGVLLIHLQSKITSLILVLLYSPVFSQEVLRQPSSSGQVSHRFGYACKVTLILLDNLKVLDALGESPPCAPMTRGRRRGGDHGEGGEEGGGEGGDGLEGGQGDVEGVEEAGVHGGGLLDGEGLELGEDGVEHDCAQEDWSY